MSGGSMGGSPMGMQQDYGNLLNDMRNVSMPGGGSNWGDIEDRMNGIPVGNDMRNVAMPQPPQRNRGLDVRFQRGAPRYRQSPSPFMQNIPETFYQPRNLPIFSPNPGYQYQPNTYSRYNLNLQGRPSYQNMPSPQANPYTLNAGVVPPSSPAPVAPPTNKTDWWKDDSTN